MKSGYKIFWSDHALDELAQTIEYLEENFTDKEIEKLALKIEDTTRLIVQSPNIYPKSEQKNAHKVVILKYNTLYFRIKGDIIEILSFFPIGKAPTKEKFNCIFFSLK